ncbi:conserved hypothetical protein [Limnobacter sp. 130]|jgi:hypothetical protein|uniref:hypothetical protein n=1 Tax=Limnobacter sp. 130 TaxID=2653147 RepID=UPI0012EFBDD2|nr:hypothetical protein [Limnobacter sp. 130]VWX36152.1 conserved hypothetical protein [Limnobacter sp. 130]
MSPGASGNWFLIDQQAVEGLGHGELLQSSSCPSDFQATLVLNSYESNCLRNWLSQRWRAKSLEQTCVYEAEHSTLLISMAMSAINLLAAREKFEAWLQAVLLDQLSAAQSRD